MRWSTRQSHVARLFRIEPRRQRRRADEIAEHDHQLPPFGRQARGGFRCRDVRRRGGLAGQGGNGLQHLAAMTDRGDAEILQIIGGQSRQQFGPDVVLLECRRVLSEPRRPQPLGDIHRRLPRQARAGICGRTDFG
jgi:hypothetical protein